MKVLIDIPDEKKNLIEDHIIYCINNNIIDGTVLNGKTRKEVLCALFKVEEINELDTCSFAEFAYCATGARFDKEWLNNEYEGW